MRSLRTRLALISTLISGVAIVGVSVLAWYFMVQSVREGLDVQLGVISGRVSRDLHPRMNVDRYTEHLGTIYGEEIENQKLILHIRDDLSENRILFSSLSDFDAFRESFPQGFPVRPPKPKIRPEWKGFPGPGKGKKGPKRRGAPGAEEELDEDAILAEILGEDFAGDGTATPGSGEVPSGVDPFEIAGPDTQIATVRAFGKEWRVAIAHSRGYFVLAAMDLSASVAELQKLKNGLLIGIPLALALIGFGGWLVAERAMRPIRKIAETASQVTARDLSSRIEQRSHPDPEIEHLIEVLNEMMGRLETGFSHATRFSADVSHELKTPIAVMQGEIETALRECEPGSSEENRLLVLGSETDRLKSITRSLMLLSQADVGELIRKSEPVDLTQELESLVEDAEILAEARSISIESNVASGLTVQGDTTLLRQALLNLVRNAIKYNDDGGIVRIEASMDSRGLIIAVENTGPGIPDQDRGKVFERFYRADRARSRGVDGFGLGLSLARAVIEGHGGEIRLVRADGEWTRFEVVLPV